jgi:hypothetical protein
VATLRRRLLARSPHFRIDHVSALPLIREVPVLLAVLPVVPLITCLVVPDR